MKALTHLTADISGSALKAFDRNLCGINTFHGAYIHLGIGGIGADIRIDNGKHFILHPGILEFPDNGGYFALNIFGNPVIYRDTVRFVLGNMIKYELHLNAVICASAVSFFKRKRHLFDLRQIYVGFFESGGESYMPFCICYIGLSEIGYHIRQAKAEQDKDRG